MDASDASDTSDASTVSDGTGKEEIPDVVSAEALKKRENEELLAKAAIAAEEKRKADLEAATVNKAINFNKNIRSLFKRSAEIISKRKQDLLNLKKSVPELDNLNHYIQLYDRTEPLDHYPFFSLVYNRYRDEILTGNDNWIIGSKKPIVIQFGEGIREYSDLKNHKIMFTDVYKMALELKDISEETMKGLTEENTSLDIVYPTILRLHLYRIFFFLTDDADKKLLGPMINKFEEELKMDSRTYVPKTEGGGAGAGLSSLFTLAKDMMGKMGFEVPANLPEANEADISKVITNVFANDQTQKTMKTIFSTLQGGNPNDLGGALNTIVKGISDPTTMDVLRQTVSNTANEIHAAQASASGTASQVSTASTAVVPATPQTQ